MGSHTNEVARLHHSPYEQLDSFNSQKQFFKQKYIFQLITLYSCYAATGRYSYK